MGWTVEQRKMFPIGAAARAAGLSVKMIRHYEAIGLLPPAARGSAGIRTFSEAQVSVLQFIARARSLGFPLRAVRSLLSLWHDPRRSNADTLHLAQEHMAELRAKRAQLDSVIFGLQQLMDACAGDGRPECPILEDIADPGGRSPASRAMSK